MTWNDGRVWVLAASIGYRTGRIRMPDLNRNFSVGSNLAPRDFFHCIPDLDLELGPLKRWVLVHVCSRCLDNIILPIIARGPLRSYTNAWVPLHSYVAKWAPDVNAYECWLIFIIPNKKN